MSRIATPPPSALGALLLIEKCAERRAQCAAVLAALERDVHQAVSEDDWETGLIEGTLQAAVLGDCDRPRVVEFLRRRDPHLPILLLTEAGAVPPTGPWMQQVLGVVEWPLRYANVEHVLERAVASRQHFGGERPADLFRGLVGRSAAINQVRTLIRQVAATDATVLVLGESGTGKEMVARNIHYLSARRGGPFVPLNCGAIPAELLESELFGHEKGAFTGAITARQGRFEMAHGGTLFLDEIGDMPLPMQVKLLRVLQERAVRPVGATRAQAVDLRIVSATHRDLDAALAAGQFRADLYYRIDVVSLQLPTLAERREDIPLLAGHFLRSLAHKYGRRLTGFAPEALEALATAPWPGNVRQLHNVVEQACALATTALIPRALVERALRVQPVEALGYAEAKRRFERNYLIQLLKLTAGNVSDAARLAERNRTEFYRLLQRHDLTPELFRGAGPDVEQ